MAFCIGGCHAVSVQIEDKARRAPSDAVLNAAPRAHDTGASVSGLGSKVLGEVGGVIKNFLAVIGGLVVLFGLLGACGLGHFQLCFADSKGECNVTSK